MIIQSTSLIPLDSSKKAMIDLFAQQKVAHDILDATIGPFFKEVKKKLAGYCALESS